MGTGIRRVFSLARWPGLQLVPSSPFSPARPRPALRHTGTTRKPTAF